MNRHLLRSLAATVAVACGAGAAPAETISMNGVTRSFTAQLADVKPAPLVIALHGNTQTGKDLASRTSWPAVAKREHFTVLFPDGLNRSWADLRATEMRAGRTPPEGTDDVAFVVKLVEKYVADGVADPKHVYVTGMSNGGAMTMTLACKRADLFAAAASVIMNFTDEFANACKPSRPVPMLVMNGTADPLVPYEGGRGTSRFAVDGFWSAEKTIAFWRKINGCEETDAAANDLGDKDPNDQSTVTLITSRCPAGRDALLYRINDGGHRMPGSFPDTRFARLVNFIFGPQNHDIDGAETIWAFFRRFP
jgi:polyhydroxybutyrate depolymerase